MWSIIEKENLSYPLWRILFRCHTVHHKYQIKDLFLEVGLRTEWKANNFFESSAVFRLSGYCVGHLAQDFGRQVLKQSPGFNTRVVHVGFAVEKQVTYFSYHFSFPLSSIIPLLSLIHSSVIQEKVNEPVRSRSSTQNGLTPKPENIKSNTFLRYLCVGK
jgi:hypothetical protein